MIGITSCVLLIKRQTIPKTKLTIIFLYFIGSYVLLHHVMGELEGRKGAWGYVEGGMGALSECIARSARDKGAHIFTDQVCDDF